MAELKNRGLQDIFIACVNGLKGFPEAIEAVYPLATVQLCIVHMVRNSLNYVGWKKRKEVAADLKRIYAAICTDNKICQKQLEIKAIQLFEDNKKIYGSRRLSEAFIKEDIKIGRFKVRRLMSKLALKPRYPKRFKVTTDSNHNEAITPNSLNRQLDVAQPNRVWTIDITYVWTLED